LTKPYKINNNGIEHNESKIFLPPFVRLSMAWKRGSIKEDKEDKEKTDKQGKLAVGLPNFVD
jgi:hypothetical protein